MKIVASGSVATIDGSDSSDTAVGDGVMSICYY